MVKQLKLAIFSLAIFLLIIFFSPLFLLHAADKQTSSSRLLVQFRPGLSQEERLKFHRDFGLSKIKKIEGLDVEVLQTDEDKLEKTIQELNRSPWVAFAEPDHKAYALEVTNDPNLSKQWGMFKIKAADASSSAWNYSQSDPSVKIAILDTGIDQDHPDLSSKIDKNQKNCTDSNTIDDLYGHGTHVAGIAAAVTNNGVGVAGVGYNASLMNVKVLADDGSGYYSWIADCIRFAADNGAKVINMSLGGGAKSKTLENAVNYAWNKGVVIVAAAGNSGNSSPTYPGYYSNVIAVAATDSNDQKASFSSYGKWVDVVAPGVSIFSTFPNHSYKIGKSLNYDYVSGTSMATPHVAGLAALVWATSYGGNNSSVRKRIESTTDKISGTGKYWTFGRINAKSAVGNAAILSETIEPTVTSTATLVPTMTPVPTATPTLIPTPTSVPTSTPTPVSVLTPTPTSSLLPWYCQRFPKWCAKFRGK